MSEFEELIEKICESLLTEERDIKLSSVLGECFDDKKVEEIKKQLETLKVQNALFGNDIVFKDSVRVLLKKYKK